MADKEMDLKFSDLFDSASVLEDGSGLKGSRSELSDEHHQKCDGFVYTGRGTTSYSETIGAGLDNLGNTCYVNAALQCFIHATPFLELIFHKQPVQCNCNYKERFCLLCVLCDLARFLLRQKKRGVSLSPWPLVNNIKYFSENFRRNEHEDVSEFIESLLNKLELCYNVPSKNDDMPSESHNLVQHTFQFLLVSKLKCSTCCQTFSTSHENFYNLSLPIVAGQTFLEALRSFMGVEKIDNHICGKCKEVVSAEKQYYIETIPSIAIFQLKIFSNKGPIMNKFGEHVHFPLQFDMLSYNETVDNIEDNYRLCALIVHIGSTLERGHYNCFIRLAAKKWLKFDDSIVEYVDEDLVLAENPYILFYAHPDVSWFSTYISSVAYSILGKKKVHEIGEGPRFGRKKTRFAPTPPPPPPTETENKDDSTTNPASSAVEENSSDGENQD